MFSYHRVTGFFSGRSGRGHACNAIALGAVQGAPARGSPCSLPSWKRGAAITGGWLTGHVGFPAASIWWCLICVFLIPVLGGCVGSCASQLTFCLGARIPIKVNQPCSSLTTGAAEGRLPCCNLHMSAPAAGTCQAQCHSAAARWPVARVLHGEVS